MALAVLVAAALVLVAVHLVAPAPEQSAAGGVVAVVAAENFWGSLAEQIGGTHARVLSLLADPNADPHELESNTTDAVAVATAALVIENGAGYDRWCAEMVAAAGSPGPAVLDVAARLGLPDGVNPHFWYDRSYVAAVVGAISGELARIDPSDGPYFAARAAGLNASLAPLWAVEAHLAATWGSGQPDPSRRVPIAATESIAQYLASSTGLDLVSPVAFMQAVSAGSDPPIASVTTFQDQLSGGSVGVLLVNDQTETPLTQQMRSLAEANGVAVVAISETVRPAGATFQAWLGAELAELEQALEARSPTP